LGKKVTETWVRVEERKDSPPKHSKTSHKRHSPSSGKPGTAKVAHKKHSPTASKPDVANKKRAIVADKSVSDDHEPVKKTKGKVSGNSDSKEKSKSAKSKHEEKNSSTVAAEVSSDKVVKSTRRAAKLVNNDENSNDNPDVEDGRAMGRRGTSKPISYAEPGSDFEYD
jgi:hypothetical protein